MPNRELEKISFLSAQSNALIASALDATVDFLHREVRLAHTFLDLAANAREQVSRERRLGRAAQAAAEVERYLTISSRLRALPDAQRELLKSELSKVHSRMSSLA
ncbi:MAG: hypothetical protein JWL95_1639 [Gemmatimonadetes bacterium]|nr:hypothetical protein [Gemmatimonadota bacterium]